MKRRAIEKASSDICNVGTEAAVPVSFDDGTLSVFMGCGKLHLVIPTSDNF